MENLTALELLDQMMQYGGGPIVLILFAWHRLDKRVSKLEWRDSESGED